MRKQQQVWQDEHASHATLPALAKTEPSSGVVQFIEYLRQRQILLKGSVIDVGCGRGRNSVYLAEQALEVYAIDYIEEALDAARKLAAQNGQTDIHFSQGEIDKQWPFDNNFFNFAIDCFSSIDIETRTGRDMYVREMLRILKPGGHALVMVVSADDAWETDPQIAKSADEPNSVTWIANGKFQKNYDQAELREFYKDFTIVELKKIQKPATKLGKTGMATNFWLVLQKPVQTVR